METATQPCIISIPVDELVIDLPLNEANVQQKMESLKKHGLRPAQPIAVWIEGMRIIDGLHRVEAARRLGWETIACAVDDCSEEAFWDQRIQSAKQHETISTARLITWIKECWAHAPFTDGERNDWRAIAEKVWEVHKASAPEWGTKPTIPESAMPVYVWLCEHARQWGYGVAPLMRILLAKGSSMDLREHASFQRDHVLDMRAAALGLNLEQREALGKTDWPWPLSKTTPEDVHCFVNENPDDKTFTEIVDERWRAKQKQERAQGTAQAEQKQAQRKAEVERYMAEAAARAKAALELARNTKEGRAQKHRQIAEGIGSLSSELAEYVHGNVEWMADMPGGAELIGAQAFWAWETIAEYWPDAMIDKPETNPVYVVYVANRKLSEANKALTERCARLERGVEDRAAETVAREIVQRKESTP